jgi:hypothetical protein
MAIVEKLSDTRFSGRVLCARCVWEANGSIGIYSGDCTPLTAIFSIEFRFSTHPFVGPPLAHRQSRGTAQLAGMESRMADVGSVADVGCRRAETSADSQ